MAIEGVLRRFLTEFGIGPSHILVAVSGGADSTALLLALTELRAKGYAISAAHVNHGLRGGESDEDQAFIEEICRSHDINLHVVRGELSADEVRNSGIEAAARVVRYARLEKVREQIDASFIATAHTRRDQTETVLMRFLTGSGTARLRGIAPMTQERIIRPLLDADRDDVLAFLTSRHIVARHDRSNDDERFLRNRIRRDIMPRLLAINPNLASTLSETARQARSQHAALEEMVRRSAEGWITEENGRTSFRLRHAPDDPWLIQATLARQIRRLEPALREISAEDLKRLARELRTLRRVSVSQGLELFRKGDEVTLSRRGSPLVPFELEIAPGTTVEIPQIAKRFTLERRAGLAGNSTNVFQLPSGARGAFVIRSRRPGDRFHPSGRSSERSLSDFLIERRIPREVRDSIPLLTWNGKIVSVPGVDISDPFKIRDSNEEVYVIVLEEDR